VMSKIPYAEVRKISAQNTVMEAFPPGSKTAIDILIEYFGKAVAGELDPQEALDRAQAEINQIYE